MKKRLIEILLILAIVLFTISIVKKTVTSRDTFSSISIGRAYLSGENLSWSEKLKFVSPREIFDLSSACLYNKFGFDGIYIFTILIASIIGVTYYYILNKISNRKILNFTFTIIVLYFLRKDFTCREQLISNLLYIVGFYSIEQLLKTDKNKYLIILIITSFIFANIDSSRFLLYAIMFLPFLVEKILFHTINLDIYEELVIENKNIKKLVIAVIIIIIICGLLLINSNNRSNTIKTIKDSFTLEVKDITFAVGVYLCSSIIFIIALLMLTKTKIRLTDAIFIFGFVFMFFSLKTTYFYYLISTICICRTINILLDTYNINIQIKKDNINIIIFVLMYLIFIIYCITNIFVEISSLYIDERYYPNNAINYMLKHLDVNNINLYNEYNYGSYIELKGIKPFLSSQNERNILEHSKEDTKLSDYYLYITDEEFNYNTILDKYNINYLLLSKKNYIKHMEENDDWNLKYEDKYFVLYEKAEQ